MHKLATKDSDVQSIRDCMTVTRKEVEAMANQHHICKGHLQDLMKVVNTVTTGKIRKHAWVFVRKYSKHAEFTGPNRFHWEGKACCAWSARYKGWLSWLQKFHPDLWEHYMGTQPDPTNELIQDAIAEGWKAI